MITCCFSRQRGVSVTELMIAIALMTILISAVGSLSGYVNRAIETRQHFNLLRWELENARERIGTWSTDEITEERILSLPFSQEVKKCFSNLTWQTKIEPLDIDRLSLSPKMRTIWLGISAEYHDQEIQPVEIYFWASPDKGSESESDES